MFSEDEFYEIEEYPGLNKSDKDFLRSTRQFFIDNGYLTEHQEIKIKRIKNNPKKRKYKNKRSFKSTRGSIEIPVHILKHLEECLEGESPCNVYLYGSQAYGTAAEESDYDFLVVFEEDKEREQYLSDELDITFKSLKKFRMDFLNGNLNLLEALLCEVKKDFELEITFSANHEFIINVFKRAECSFFKGKRILRGEQSGGELKGRKSFFHCLRQVKLLQQVLLKEEINPRRFKDLYDKIVEKECTKSQVSKLLEKNKNRAWDIYRRRNQKK